MNTVDIGSWAKAAWSNSSRLLPAIESLAKQIKDPRTLALLFVAAGAIATIAYGYQQLQAARRPM